VQQQEKRKKAPIQRARSHQLVLLQVRPLQLQVHQYLVAQLKMKATKSNRST
jgi:hypothetical protein